MTKEEREIRAEYPFLYETHMHTAPISACAKYPAWQMAKAYKEAGYTGIIITDHNWGGNCSLKRSKPFTEWVTEFVTGYEQAKEYGDNVGLQVFFGYEAGYQGTEFLIYGVDGNWLKKNPEIQTATVKEQYEMIHDAGGMVIHAHPFREEPYIPEIRLFPEYVDGVEGINATHSNHLSKSHNVKEFDDRAVQYANEHQLPITAGSDMHWIQLFGGGMAFKRKLDSIADYKAALLEGEDYILTNGDSWFDKRGNRL